MNTRTIAVARENLISHLRTAVLMTIVLTVLLGIVYPLIMTGIAQVLFPSQANGSLVRDSRTRTPIGRRMVLQQTRQFPLTR